MLADGGLKLELLLHHALIRYMAEMLLFGVGDGDGERPLYISEAVNCAADKVWSEVVCNLSREVDLVDVNEMMDASREWESVFKAAAVFGSGRLEVQSEWRAGSFERFLDGMKVLVESDCEIGPGVKYAMSKYGARGSDCTAVADARFEEIASGW